MIETEKKEVDTKTTKGNICSSFDHDCFDVKYPNICVNGSIDYFDGTFYEIEPADGVCPFCGCEVSQYMCKEADNE